MNIKNLNPTLVNNVTIGTNTVLIEFSSYIQNEILSCIPNEKISKKSVIDIHILSRLVPVDNMLKNNYIFYKIENGITFNNIKVDYITFSDKVSENLDIYTKEHLFSVYDYFPYEDNFVNIAHMVAYDNELNRLDTKLKYFNIETLDYSKKKLIEDFCEEFMTETYSYEYVLKKYIEKKVIPYDIKLTFNNNDYAKFLMLVKNEDIIFPKILQK